MEYFARVTLVLCVLGFAGILSGLFAEWLEEWSEALSRLAFFFSILCFSFLVVLAIVFGFRAIMYFVFYGLPV